jgi:regulator of protease activity HflC (stomatin/prohibitin superfamily)
MALAVIYVLAVVGSILAILLLSSFTAVGPTEVGLITKRFSFKKLPEDNPVAFNSEAGYQADLLMPGLRWRFVVLYKVEKFPWVQVPAGEIGVVIAQVGSPLPIGAKSAAYKPGFGNFSNLRSFIETGGQKGVQRPVLPPGTLIPIHPVAFLVITTQNVYGLPIDPELKILATIEKKLTPESFGLRKEQLQLTIIQPEPQGIDGEVVDMVGIVTTLEGEPLPPGAIASRLGDFADIAEMEKNNTVDADLIEVILGSKNELHNNYQDFQAFLANGGKIGLQHDPLLYGAFALNPFLVRVEKVPMLVVKQGEVAVVKGYVGLPTKDTSGEMFKYGSLVRPGHRGIWQEPLRTGKYAINPRCYQPIIVSTAILTLNWAEATSRAHNLDNQLCQIEAKSNEGFIFKIDLQVQIHVADTQAPRVISMVGTMQNLVNEVLQAAVGNHFRDKLQSMPAVDFIKKRQEVQGQAFNHVREHLNHYQVETRGVYIQDVVLPKELVQVLTEREIANQNIETYKKEKEAEDQRILMQQARGTADMQEDLARSQVEVEINVNKAKARKAEADGESFYIEKTGTAHGAKVRAVGLARAEGYEAQVRALGQIPTAVVNAINALSEGNMKIIPDVLVTSGSNGLGSIEGLAAALMKKFNFSHTPPSDSPLQAKDSKEKKSTKETGKKAYKEPGEDFGMNDHLTTKMEDLQPFTEEDLNQVPTKNFPAPAREKPHPVDKKIKRKSLPWDKRETKVIQ